MGPTEPPMSTTVRRQHFCQLCPCKYTTKHNLQEHIRIKHQGACPFQCLYSPCLRSFSYKHHLKRHMKTVHEKSTKRWCQCGREFSRWSSYERHLNSRIGAECSRTAGSMLSGNAHAHVGDSKEQTPFQGRTVLGNGVNPLTRTNSDASWDFSRSVASSTPTHEMTTRYRNPSSSSATSIMSIDSIINPVEGQPSMNGRSRKLIEKHVNDEKDGIRTMSNKVETLAHKLRLETYDAESWGHERMDRLRTAIDLINKVL